MSMDKGPAAEPLKPAGLTRTRKTSRVKYQAELDPKFANRVADLAHGEKFLSCIQCGTCSATCPVSQYMDYTPRKLIAMIREGFQEEVLSSRTIWLCASCYSCTVECPKEIKITDVMYALKREAIFHGVVPKGIGTPVLAREFFKGVKKRGRNSETRLMVNLYLKTRPLDAFRDMGLGMKLFSSGRLPLGTEKIKDQKTLAKLLAAVEDVQKGCK
jgi:quinone-modifying oxidoreductase subunit QmoC